MSSATLRLPRAALEERHRQRAVDVVGALPPSGPRERREAPARRRRGRFDRDHLGTHRREEERASGPGDEPADVEHAHVRERRAASLGFVASAHAGGASSRRRWRSTNFWILPLGVRGNSSIARTSSGHFCRARPRCFEVRAHRDQVRRGDAGLHAEERAAESRRAAVGRGDDRDLGDAGHAHQQLLDLRRAHVLAAADDDVLLAIGDREVAVGVEHADVAGHEPTVGRERLRGQRRVGVADEAVGAAAPDLARLAGRHVVAVVVDEADLDAGQRRAVGVEALLARRLRAAARDRRVLGDPKLRIVVMPSRSARSPTAAGTAEPPRPITGINGRAAPRRSRDGRAGS